MFHFADFCRAYLAGYHWPPANPASRLGRNRVTPRPATSNLHQKSRSPPSHPQTFHRPDFEIASTSLRDTLPACNTICAFHLGCKTHHVLVTSSHNCRQKDPAARRDRNQTKAPTC